jgi:hypothetical protein
MDRGPSHLSGPECWPEKRHCVVPAGVRLTRIHVRAAGLAHQRNALPFRDYLSASRCGGLCRAEAPPGSALWRGSRDVCRHQGPSVRPGAVRGGGVGDSTRMGRATG